MSLPLHVYGTTDPGSPYAWMVRLRDPFLLAWPEDPNRPLAIRMWPKPASWTPEVHNGVSNFIDFCQQEGKGLHFGVGEVPPQHLYVEEPDGVWVGVLDLWHGYLMVPNSQGLLLKVPEFRIPPKELKIPLEYGEALVLAQRWHDDFVTSPQFTLESDA